MTNEAVLPGGGKALSRLESSGSGFLEALREAGLQDLASIGVRQRFSAGAVLFHEGEKADGLHVLLAGRVKVYKTSPRGRTQTLLLVGPVEPLGEVAAFLNGAYPASALAVEPAETLYLPREALIAAIRQNPDAALRFVALLSRRLNALTELVADLSLRDVSERLASYLLSLVNETMGTECVRLGLAKRELAAALGTVPETLSRAFAQLERAGAIELRGRTIRVCDRVFLAQLAGKSMKERYP